VMLLKQYVDLIWIDDTLRALQAVRHEGYYVKMALAWALCECYIKQREKTLPVLRGGLADAFVQNKAISKLCDSYRVTPEEKQALRRLRK